VKITDYSRSTPGLWLGTAANANAIGGVSVSSNSPALPGTIPVSISSNMFAWRDALSFGSNTNDVSSVGTMGSSPSNTRADHVHRGVHSIAHTSNTLYGDVTLVAGTGMGITVAGGNVRFDSSAAGGSGSTFSHPSMASNSFTSNTVLTNDASIAITMPVFGTFHFSAPFVSEVVTDSSEIVWHGADVVHDLVRIY
jgi:hypothetical protein